MSLGKKYVYTQLIAFLKYLDDNLSIVIDFFSGFFFFRADYRCFIFGKKQLDHISTMTNTAFILMAEFPKFPFLPWKFLKKFRESFGK